MDGSGPGPAGGHGNPVFFERRDSLSTYAAADSGWAPVHAAELLGELGAAAAVLPMLDTLADTEWDDLLHDRIILSLPKIGPPVLEPTLARLDSCADDDLRRALKNALADTAVRDERVYALLLEGLASEVEAAANDLAAYGDPAAIDHLAACLDERDVVESGEPFVNQPIIELCDAIEVLGGQLSPEQEHKLAKVRAIARRAVPVRSNAPVRRAPRPGRNEPCHCGSGRKYKKCCLRSDEGARL